VDSGGCDGGEREMCQEEQEARKIDKQQATSNKQLEKKVGGDYLLIEDMFVDQYENKRSGSCLKKDKTTKVKQ
jgi:hypothetical protein